MPLGTTLPLPLVGTIVKAVAEQIVAAVSNTIGFGLTTTVIVKVVPTQLPVSPEVGVTVYTMV